MVPLRNWKGKVVAWQENNLPRDRGGKMPLDVSLWTPAKPKSYATVHGENCSPMRFARHLLPRDQKDHIAF
jgi:hypothetical protein